MSSLAPTTPKELEEGIKNGATAAPTAKPTPSDSTSHASDPSPSTANVRSDTPGEEKVRIKREDYLLRNSRTPQGKLVLELRRRIMHFTPSWFVVTMGTGITSILMYNLPYQFRGLKNIGNVVFVLNVVIFLVFLLMSIARYILWPKLWIAMIRHNQQSLQLGTFSMGLSTLVNMLAYSVAPAFSPSSIGVGGGWVTFTWVLWWINSVVSVAIAVGVPYQMFVHQQHSYDQVGAAWLLPTVSTIVTSATGGILATILPPAHARLTLIVSYILWGTGFPVAILILALYYARLAIHKIPPCQQVVSCFIPLGPCGQGAFAILQISTALRTLAKATGNGLPSGGYAVDEGLMMAHAIYGVSMAVALIIWGFGLFWFLIACFTILHLARQSKIPFNMSWWATTFPIGVWTTSTIQFGKELDSTAFKVLGTILAGIEITNWLVCFSLTCWQAWKGSIFQAPCLSEMVDADEPPELQRR